MKKIALSAKNLEQLSRVQFIRIIGLPEKSCDNTESKVCKVFLSNIDRNVSHSDINCSRIGRKTSKKPQPILVTFSSTKTQVLVPKSRKLLKGSKLTIKDLTYLCHRPIIYNFYKVWI